VTYTATVTPSHGGTGKPSGSVRFEDAGTPISSCASQSLAQGPSASSATCTLGYGAAGSHTITATYGGDATFSGSSSSAQAVTVQAVTAEAGPPAGGQPAPTAPAAVGTGGVGVLASTTAAPSANELRASIAAQLLPSGKGARIVAVLKHGGVSQPVRALEAGSLVIAWYQVPGGARIAAAKPKPTLVASGRITFSAAGRATIKLRLSAAGRRLLGHAAKLALTAKGTFTPRAGARVSVLRKFTLRR
jgi:hypothetical protein